MCVSAVKADIFGEAVRPLRKSKKKELQIEEKEVEERGGEEAKGNFKRKDRN